MTEIELCGHVGCSVHLKEYDKNYDVRRSEAYRNRSLLCRLGSHGHSRKIGDAYSYTRECVRCTYRWEEGPDH